MNIEISHNHYIKKINFSKRYLFMKGLIVKVRRFISLIICLVLIGCSSGRYMVADRYLKQYDYQNALEEYIRIANMSGSISISRDVRALTGAMIAYYKLSNYKKSFAVSKHILSIDKYNSSAIFYAGMNLEMLNKQTLAKKVYRYYTALSRYDPYYKLIKAQFNKLIQNEMEKRAQLAIKMEKNINMDQIAGNTIAVLYFLNVVDDPDWNSLSKGLAEMLITDLSQVNNLKVLERIYLQKLIEEMQLGMSGLTDESTVPRMGRLMKARNLINGAFTIKPGQNLVITSSLFDVVSSTNVQTAEFSGDINNIFQIEKDIVFAAIDQLGIQLSDEEKKKIGKYATRNFDALKAFSQGLDHYDMGNYASAMIDFQEAIKFDPNFMLALDMFDITNALESIEQGTFVAMHFEMTKPTFAADAGMMNLMSTQYRLNQISQNLDLGYLPGNDSRNGASEIISQDRFLREDWRNLEPLQPPPSPPPVPPNN